MSGGRHVIEVGVGLILDLEMILSDASFFSDMLYQFFHFPGGAVTSRAVTTRIGMGKGLHV